MVTLDFIGYINATSSANAAEKGHFLDDLCYSLGYSDTVVAASGETIPNPETKRDFANRAVMEWLKATVRARRAAIAYAQIVVGELTL